MSAKFASSLAITSDQGPNYPLRKSFVPTTKWPRVVFPKDEDQRSPISLEASSIKPIRPWNGNASTVKAISPLAPSPNTTLPGLRFSVRLDSGRLFEDTFPPFPALTTMMPSAISITTPVLPSTRLRVARFQVNPGAKASARCRVTRLQTISKITGKVERIYACYRE